MTMTSDNSERYSGARPGFRLLSCEDAALPFFWLTMEAVVQERKRMPPLHEFVLRTISAGMDSVESAAGLLGVERQLIESTVADLWERDLVDYPSLGPHGRSLQLTREGTTSLEELMLQGPERREIWIAFDRLLWEPVLLRRELLLPPRELKDRNLLEVRPATNERPDIRTLDIAAIDKQLKQLKQLSSGGREQFDVLALRRVVKAERMFLPCDVLLYQSEDAKESDVGLAIDGRPSEPHDAALAALGGVKHLSVTIGPPASRSEAVEALPPETRQQIESQAVTLDEVDRIRSRTTEAVAKLERLSLEAALDEPGEPDPEIERAQAAIENEHRAIRSIEVREIDTFEHALIFSDARRTTLRRLLIVSPWISGQIVDREFVSQLRSLARAGVTIRIGYGIDDKRAKSLRDRQAEDELLRLGREFKVVVVARLGDTHAKVLLWDDSLIVGSFNWLSFGGDEDRTYRQERGMLVRVRSAVESSWNEHSARIEAAAAAAGND